MISAIKRPSPDVKKIEYEFIGEMRKKSRG